MNLKFISFLLISFCLVSCNHNTPNTFLLEGEIVGLPDSTTLVLSYLTSNDDRWMEVIDTAYIIDRKFAFEGNIGELTAAFLDFENTFICLYLEPVTMNLKLNKEQPWLYELSGTKAEVENIVLREKLKPKEEELYKELSITHNIVDQINLSAEDISKKDSLINLLEINGTKRAHISSQIDKVRLNYIIENKTSKIAPHLIYIMAKKESIGIDTLKTVYNCLSEDSKTTILGRLAYKQIEQNERLANRKNIRAGSIVPNFSIVDPLGNKIKLSDYYDQNYVLLDFWSSWCKPCLEQVPQMKEIQNNYSSKGLVIIGISLDEDKKQWLNAIQKHKLDFCLQVLSKTDSESDYFATDISDVLDVEYIPAYFLIDKQGKVLAKWNHIGEEELAVIDRVLKLQP